MRLMLLGYVSPSYSHSVCAESKSRLVCPANYVIVISDEFIFATQNGCEHSAMECREPTNIVTEACAGHQSCDFVFSEIEINNCVDKYADLLEYTFKCIPSKTPTRSSLNTDMDCEYEK